MPTFLLNLGFCAMKEQVQSNVAWKQNQNMNFFSKNQIRTGPRVPFFVELEWNQRFFIKLNN
jgi:hypothetical protein